MRRTYSYSKRNILDTCTRQYFYEYYASAKKCPFDSSRKNKIRELKEFTNSFMTAGGILHQLIHLYFHRGSDWSASWFFNTASEWFNKHLFYSRDPKGSPHMENTPYPPKMFVEFYYDDPLAEDFATRALESLNRAMENFFTKSLAQEISNHIRTQEQYCTEKRVTGLKLADYSIGGKVDAIAIDASGARIVDWKMGLPSDDLDSLQLFIYGWWASVNFSLNPEQIRVQRVFLGNGEAEKEIVLNEHLLRRGKARLIQDIELMKEMDFYGRKGNEGAFTSCRQENICRKCKYQEVCTEKASNLSSKQTSLPLTI